MGYSELIKSLDTIRMYAWSFYVYGFKGAEGLCREKRSDLCRRAAAAVKLYHILFINSAGRIIVQAFLFPYGLDKQLFEFST